MSDDKRYLTRLLGTRDSLLTGKVPSDPSFQPVEKTLQTGKVPSDPSFQPGDDGGNSGGGSGAGHDSSAGGVGE